LGSRLRLARWLSARRHAVGVLVSVGIKTAASRMAVSKTPRSRSSAEHQDRHSGWRDGCRKTLRSRATYLALISARIEMAAGGMAVGKT